MLAYHFEGVPRGPIGVALKNILTLGIHTKVWLYRVNREMDGHEGFHIDLRWLAVMLWLPIVTPAIVKFQTARRMNQMVSHQVTLGLIRARNLGWVSLVPVVGAGFYAYWVQTTLNRHWFHHRREERLRLAKDRIAALAALPEPTQTQHEKLATLQADVARMEREMAEEIEAARIRWGEEAFADRMRRAELHAARGARMTRKELAAWRAETARHRKEAKAARRAGRGRFFGLLPPKATQTKTANGSPPDAPAGKATRRDPDDDAHWQPRTPLPERTPEAIEAAAAAEGRELTKAEQAETKKAERLIMRREKEVQRLEVEREKLRGRLEKGRTRAEAKAEKRRLQEEAKAEKVRLQEEAKAEKERLRKERTEAKAGLAAEKKGGEGRAKPDKKAKRKTKEPDVPAATAVDEGAIPVATRSAPRRLRAPPDVHDAGEGPLRILTVRCPRCATEIENINKRGDAPAKITCPSCQLVGKV